MPAPGPNIRRRPARKLEITFGGWVYLGMTLFMGLAAVNVQVSLLFGTFGLMVGVVVVSFMLSRLVLRRLKVQRLLPSNAVVGRPLTIPYEFTNRKRFWPSLSVSVREVDSRAFARPPAAYLLHAAPRTTATVPAQAMPLQRGLQPLDALDLQSSFPFGFLRRRVRLRHPQSLLVWPALARVHPRVIQQCLAAEHTAAANPPVQPRIGGSDEFYGVKEFRVGDNPRFLNWRRSARTGVLVANEMTQVAPPRLMLLVDTYATDAPSLELVERAVAMAASLATTALERGLGVGLHAWADSWVTVSPSRGKRHQRDLLSHLACLPRNHQQDVMALLASGGPWMRQQVTPVLFSPHALPLEAGMPAGRRCVVLAADALTSRQSFVFDPEVDFAACAAT